MPLIGKPAKRRGYLPGMILRNGKMEAGIGGGLCQLSNLIFWMTLHRFWSDTGTDTTFTGRGLSEAGPPVFTRTAT